MREILFRGKDKSTGNWVYGYLSYSEQEEIYYIGFQELMTPVILETVGQFTGLLDKNGDRIFEGDIVKVLYSDWISKSDNDPRSIDEYMFDIAAKGVIEFNDCEFGIKICSDILDSIHCGRHGFIQITGNIHDN